MPAPAATRITEALVGPWDDLWTMLEKLEQPIPAYVRERVKAARQQAGWIEDRLRRLETAQNAGVSSLDGWVGEVPEVSGSIITLSQAPNPASLLSLFYNGSRLVYGQTGGLIESVVGNVAKVSFTPAASSLWWAWYPV